MKSIRRWHDAVLFEDIEFKKSYSKDKKRKCRSESNPNYNATPLNHQVTESDIKTLVNSIECNKKAQHATVKEKMI